MSGASVQKEAEDLSRCLIKSLIIHHLIWARNPVSLAQLRAYIAL